MMKLPRFSDSHSKQQFKITLTMKKKMINVDNTKQQFWNETSERKKNSPSDRWRMIMIIN